VVARSECSADRAGRSTSKLETIVHELAGSACSAREGARRHAKDPLEVAMQQALIVETDARGDLGLRDPAREQLFARASRGDA
jgi:hypothetical protein